jgi:hypothetical protein
MNAFAKISNIHVVRALIERRIKMTSEAKIKLTSTELGTLWMTYQSTTASLILYDLIKDKTFDKEAQNILTSYISDGQEIKNQIVNVFNNEESVIPIGFDEQDVIRVAPPLFDDILI